MKQVSEKVDLIQSIRKVTVIIFLLGVIVFAVAGLCDRFSLVRSETKKIRSDYTDEQKQIIKTQVESTVMFITLAKDSGISRENIIESVREIRFGEGKDEYIFIVTYDGTTLLNDTQRQLEGENIWDLTDPNGVKVIQEERRAIENLNGDFIYYFWNHPSTGEITPKVSFIKGVPEWEWMVGSGVYLDSLDQTITGLQNDVIKKTGIMALTLAIILLFILFFTQFIFERFTMTVANEIRSFSIYFNSASVNTRAIDISNIRYREFSSIAEDMNRMVKNKLEADARIFLSEQRLQMQREQSPLGYLEYDLESNIIYWNPVAERIFGYSRNEMLGRSYDILIPTENIAGVSNIFTGLLDGSVSNDEGIRIINENVTKNGRRITCEWYNKTLTDQNGKVLSIIALVDDITDRKLMEDKLQESLEEKKVLLKEIHHRVKNNMAIISSFLSLQSMNIEDEYVCSLLQSSENRVRSMALIHEHLYKSENLKDINIQIYIDELLITLLDSYGYGADDIRTRTEIIQFKPNLDLLIPLGMLVNEIISNALKHAYSNIDAPELSISLFEGKPGELVLLISDNGIGIPLESEINYNDSIGFMLIDGLAKQINGKMEIHKENGTQYKITIPV